MAHNRKLTLGGVALTKARNNRFSIEVGTEVRDELESVLIQERFFDNAPFGSVTLILRYGLQNDDVPTIQRISKNYGDLPVAIELDTHVLREASREELKRLFLLATLKALLGVAEKHGLPARRLAELKNKL